MQSRVGKIVSARLEQQGLSQVTGEKSRFFDQHFASVERGAAGFRQHVFFRYLRLSRSYEVSVGLEHLEGRRRVWSAVTELGISSAVGVRWIGDADLMPCLVSFPVSAQLGFELNGVPANRLTTSDWLARMSMLLTTTFALTMGWDGYVRLLLQDTPSEFAWTRGNPGFRLAALCLAVVMAEMDKKILVDVQTKYRIHFGKSDFLGNALNGEIVERLLPLLQPV